MYIPKIHPNIFLPLFRLYHKITVWQSHKNEYAPHRLRDESHFKLMAMKTTGRLHGVQNFVTEYYTLTRVMLQIAVILMYEACKALGLMHSWF